MKKTYYTELTHPKRAESDWGRNSDCQYDWKAPGARRYYGVPIKRERETHSRKRGSQREREESE